MFSGEWKRRDASSSTEAGTEGTDSAIANTTGTLDSGAREKRRVGLVIKFDSSYKEK